MCGGGNGAHVLSGLAAADPHTEVRVLTLFREEARDWTKSMETNDFTVNILNNKDNDKDKDKVKTLKNKPDRVSKDPSIAKECNMILFVVPAFGHKEYLEKLKPYVTPGTAIIGMPGQAGFELDVMSALGDIAKDCPLGNFESLPWACRIESYGKEVTVLGTKEGLAGSINPGQTSTLKDPIATLQRILGKNPALVVKGHILGMTLMSTNAYLHPSILYAKWKDYKKGDVVSEAPLFYHGIDKVAADTLSGISDEILNTAKAIMEMYPDIDLSNVIHIYDWFMQAYHDQIENKGTLYDAIRSNKAYKGLTHPMVKVDDDDKKLKPDFRYRYFTEDLPYGLVCLRGIAELAGVATPTMDKVIEWAQNLMEKSYLVKGNIAGSDVKSTRSPQAFGYTLDKVLGK